MPKNTNTKQEVDDSSSSSSDTEEVSQYINVAEFDINKFYVKNIDDKYSSKSQYMAFPRYKLNKKSKDGDNVIIVTEPIKLEKGGIPKIDGEYKKSDADREFFWLGCDEKQENCVQLFKVLNDIDEKYNNLIGKNDKTKTICTLKDGKATPLDKLEYSPLVRDSQIPENLEESKKEEYTTYKRIKVRFNTKWVSGQDDNLPGEITTHLFLLDKEEPEPYTTVSDFEKSLRWGCEARFVLSVNKFWAMKSTKNNRRECGFTIKCLQVYITKESQYGGGVSQVEKFKKRLFSPSGAPLTHTNQTTHSDSSNENVKTKKTLKQVSESEDSDSEKQTKKKEDSNSESDDDEPKSKTNRMSKSKKLSSDSEESDSEDEDEKPKPKAKSKSK